MQKKKNKNNIKRLKPFSKIKEKKSWQLSSRTHTFFFDYFFFVVLNLMKILIMVKKLKEIAVVKNKPLSKSRQTIVDNVDNIIALIANNVSYKSIAERYKVCQSTLFYTLDCD